VTVRVEGDVGALRLGTGRQKPATVIVGGGVNVRGANVLHSAVSPSCLLLVEYCVVPAWMASICHHSCTAAAAADVKRTERESSDCHWRRQGGPRGPSPPMAGENFFFK